MWLLVKTFPHCHRPLSAEANEAWTAYRVPAWTRQGVQKVMKKSPGALHTNRAAFRSIIPLELHAPRLRALTLEVEENQAFFLSGLLPTTKQRKIKIIQAK